MPGGAIQILVEPDVKGFPGKLESGLRSSTGIATKVGSGIATALGVGLLGAGAAFSKIISLTTDFQGSLNNLQAVTGATGDQMAQVSAKAQALGNDIQLPGTSAATAADAMLELAKGGLTVQQSMDAAKGTLTLAAAAQIDGARAAQIQSDALNQFGLQASDAGHVADLLANSANASAVEITDVAESMKFVGPVAHAMGVSLEDTTTAIALLGNAGIRGSEAGTALRGMLASLSAPSKQSASALRDLGVNAYDAQGKFVGFPAIIDQLRTAQGKQTDAQFQNNVATAFGRETMSGVLALVNSAPGSWDKMEAAVTRSGGAQEVAAAKMKGLGGAIEGFKSQLETTAIAIGLGLSPALEGLVRGATGVVGFLTDAASGAGNLTDRFPGLNKAVEVGKQLWGDFTTILGNAREAVQPVVDGVEKLATSTGKGGGAVELLSRGVGLLGTAAAGASEVLKPIGEILGGILSVAAELPGPLQAAALAYLAFKVVPGIISAVRGETDGAATSTGRLSKAAGALTAPISGATSGLRQFRGEMRLQQSLAAASGVSLSKLGSAQAAFETSTLKSVSAVRSFRDDVRTLKDAATGAGAPISGLEASIGALAQRSPAVAAMAGSFDVAASSVRAFGDTAGEAANRATTALGERLAGGAQRGVDGLLKIPGAVKSAASSLSTGLQVAANRAGLELEALPGRVAAVASSLSGGLQTAVNRVGLEFDALPGRVRSAASTLTTGIGVAAIDAGQKLTALGASARSAASTVSTALGVAAIDTAAKIRQLPAAATQAGQALSTGLQTAVVRAGLELQALPATAGNAVRSLGTSLRDGATTAGSALVAGLKSSMSTAASAVGDGLRSIPDVVRGTFEKVGSGIDVGVKAVGRFTSIVAGAGASLGTGLLKGAGSLISFLGGPWGIALAGAGIALGLLGQRQQEAAQKAQEHKSKVDALAGSMDKLTGAASSATRELAAQELTNVKLGDGTTTLNAALVSLGISTRDYVDATTGNVAKQQQVAAVLNAHTKAVIENSATYQRGQSTVASWGVSLDDLTAAANGNEQALAKVNAAVDAAAKGNPQAAKSYQNLKTELLGLGGTSAEVSKQFGASIGTYNESKAAADAARQATQEFGDALKGLTELRVFDAIAAGNPVTREMAAGLAQAGASAEQLALSTGHTVAATSGLQQGAAAAGGKMQELRDQFIQAATQAGLTADQAGRLADSYGLIPSAVSTIISSNADAVGAELITLKAQFDAVPGEKSVTVNALTDEAKAKLVDMGFTVTTLPNGQILVTANTDPAKANLAAAVAATNSAKGTITIDGNKDPATGKITQTVQLANGSKGTITVDGNPDPATGKIRGTVTLANGSKGTITIDGNQTPANGKINATVTYANGRTGTIQVNANTAAASAAINSVAGAHYTATVRVNVVQGSVTAAKYGGLLHFRDGGVAGAVGFAGGGTAQRRRLRPLPGGIASIVPPNTWRIVGDRMRDDEAYIPINRSRRSQRIFEETAKRMGYQVARMYADGGLAARTTSAVTSARIRQVATGGPANLAPVVAELGALRKEVVGLRAVNVEINNPRAEPSSASLAATLRTQAAMARL